ncbi:MAG: ABC transporter permease, partial [Acidobacteria bacterium]|nr:ABC transporter permease [Acidobacteriota bacterium]
MLKALAWKEWREQRPVVLAAFLLTLLLPLLVALGKSMLSGRVDFGAVAYDCTLLYGALLWPLTALLAGAGTISGEAQGGTLPFLFTRPVRRTTIWTVKVAAGVVSLLIVAVASGLFASLLVALTGGGTGSFLLGSDFSRLMAGEISYALLYVSLFMVFTSAVFFSTLISKPLLGAGAALALSFGVLVLMVTLQFRLKILLGQEADWILVEVVLLGVLLLVASLFLFARGEMVRGAGRRLGHVLMGVAVLLAAALVVLPLVRAFPRLAPGEARITAAVPSPDGRQLLMAVNGRVSPVGRIWSLNGPDHEFARLTGITSGSPAFTPDGQWVVYLGVETLNGQMSIRKMRPNGSDDRLLAMMPR